MSTHRENPMTAAATHAGRPQSASAQVPEVPLTTEGYSVLHQMMRFRWTAWRALPSATQKEIAQEAADPRAAVKALDPAGRQAVAELEA